MYSSADITFFAIVINQYNFAAEMYSSKIYESWREIQYEKYEMILEEIKKAELNIGSLILDLGAAKGFLKDFVSMKSIDLEIVAMDVDFLSLKSNSSEHRVLADGNFIPFKDNVFDSLFCVDVAHLLENFTFNCVKKEGTIVLALPTRYENKFEEILDSVENCEVVKKFKTNGREKELVALMRRT